MQILKNGVNDFSLLDTDWHNITMMQAVHHMYPDTHCSWCITISGEEDFSNFESALKEKISCLDSLFLTKEEAAYLNSFSYIKPDFVRFLELFRINKDYIETKKTESGFLVVISGPWVHCILLKSLVFSFSKEISSLKTIGDKENEEDFFYSIEKKIRNIEDMPVSSFGILGGYANIPSAYQSRIIRYLKERYSHKFSSVSNVDMARRHNLSPLGTMTEEWSIAHQQLGSRLIGSHNSSLEAWVKEYRGSLGIAITNDEFSHIFFNDFDLYFSKLFDGVKYSGSDPEYFCEMLLRHYKRVGIDARTKNLVLSNSYAKFDDIKTTASRFRNNIGVVLEVSPELIKVEKSDVKVYCEMTYVNEQPVANPKIGNFCQSSLDSTRTAYLSYLRSSLGLEW